MSFKPQEHQSIDETLETLTDLVSQIDPDVGYDQWIKVLMVIRNETNGSKEGFELADAWSSQGAKYRGTKDVRAKWRCIKSNHRKPVRMGTLFWMVNQIGTQ